MRAGRDVEPSAEFCKERLLFRRHDLLVMSKCSSASTNRELTTPADVPATTSSLLFECAANARCGLRQDPDALFDLSRKSRRVVHDTMVIGLAQSACAICVVLRPSDGHDCVDPLVEPQLTPLAWAKVW